MDSKSMVAAPLWEESYHIDFEYYFVINRVYSKKQ
jgi:hypothetical protein